MNRINENIAPYDEAAADEYDKALVFALKKWIADEINEIYDNKVCALCFTIAPAEYGWCGAIGYDTANAGNGAEELSLWKKSFLASIDDDENVDGSLEIWIKFKGWDFSDSRITPAYLSLVQAAVQSLMKDGIFAERFGSDMPAIHYYA
ncbi:MAG: hypothetical protein J6M90_03865 [Oscillospiraceae bacterium]|jgi:hypothetical protein|nr:hypothetical protein [Oscillospiraceae bacterium]MBQ9208724.1 hypothetical protein [Oscillospiraceae bacterium]